jgi:hypothetical protein
MLDGFLHLWFSYILIRQTTIPDFKCMKTAGIMTRRTFGIMFCLLGVERLIFDNSWWLNNFSEYRNIIPYFVLIIMSFGLIISLFFDVKNSLRADRVSLSKTRFKKQPLSLITWDMWLVTGIGLFFLIYYAISI